MPKLRKIKDYDISFDPSEFEQDDEHDLEQQPNGDDKQASWWSDSSIIASLPDDKLLQALSRYRESIRLCEQELARRAVTPTPSRYTKSFDVIAGRHRYHSVPLEERVVSRRGSRRTSNTETSKRRQPKRRDSSATGVSLSPDQMLLALQALQAIMKRRPPE